MIWHDFPKFSETDWHQFTWTLTPVGQRNKNRDVYFLDDDFVLKMGEFANPPIDYLSNGQNLMEAKIWEHVQGTFLERYLTPVIASDTESGLWLVMQRVQPVRSPYEVPEMIGDLKQWGFWDIKWENVGILDNERAVLLDYGVIREGLFWQAIL